MKQRWFFTWVFFTNLNEVIEWQKQSCKTKIMDDALKKRIVEESGLLSLYPEVRISMMYHLPSGLTSFRRSSTGNGGGQPQKALCSFLARSRFAHNACEVVHHTMVKMKMLDQMASPKFTARPTKTPFCVLHWCCQISMTVLGAGFSLVMKNGRFWIGIGRHSGWTMSEPLFIPKSRPYQKKEMVTIRRSNTRLLYDSSLNPGAIITMYLYKKKLKVVHWKCMHSSQ